MTQFSKYYWLLNTIRRAGKISLRDLSDLWERSSIGDGRPLARTTFNRWREFVESEFGAEIRCARHGEFLYYIANDEDIDDDHLKSWMLDSIAMGNVVKENLALADRVLVDAIPSGRVHLTTFMNAMQENIEVEVSYRKFDSATTHTFTIAPYALKLFENRWYVLGLNKDLNVLRIYALDRMERAIETGRRFKLPARFSAQKYFAPYCGIWTSDTPKVEKVVLRAEPKQAKYMESLPLHPSQRVVVRTDDHVDFALEVVPTADFINKILQAGAKLQVIAPDSLRNEMRLRTQEMAMLYQ